MASLREKLSRTIDDHLVPLISGRAHHICIIDPPGHPNVGDSAILLGELDFIAREFPRARLSFYDVDSYTPYADRYIEEASILLIHGGGNFGDIWPHHHAIRMRILEQFPHKPIIQMPQSISFSSLDELQRTRETISKQSDFNLFVRDVKSLAFAEKHFGCSVQLVPDMAFAMKPITRKLAIADDFCLLRTDKEVAANHTRILNVLRSTGRSVEVGDWIEEPRGMIAWLDREFKFATNRRARVLSPLRPALVALRHKYAMQRVNFGIRMLSRGRRVVTDRLHAHILSCLMDIPNVFFDSSDGKISAFYETWTKAQSTAHFAMNPDDLVLSTE